MGKATKELTIYQKPTCTTCREALKIVRASGADFASVNYYEEPFTKAKLKRLLKKAGLRPQDVLRTKENIYKKLQLARKPRTDEQVVDLMIKYPDLIQRPLVERGDRVILARPAETVKKVLR